MTASLTSCPSCRSDELEPILVWPSIPVNASLFPATRQESLAIPRAPFRLVACSSCGLLFNADHDDRLVEYSPECTETQSGSPRYRAFADDLAKSWIEAHGLAGARVVEVGCGFDAGFLQRMAEISDGTGVGIDPALAAPPSLRVSAISERFTTMHATVAGKALVCRHTLEHVPDLGAFLDAVHAWSAANDGAPVLFEVPDAKRILEECAFWDMYYEHCTYFTADTLAAAFRLHSLHPERLELVYDGQYIVLDARPGQVVPPDPSLGATVVDAAREFGLRVGTTVERAAERLRSLGAEQPTVVWQAGGKALALMTLTGAAEAISGMVDVNPAKHGRFLPGTALEISAPDGLRAIQPGYVVLMNDVYLDEVRRALASLDLDAKVITMEQLAAAR